MDYTCLVYVSTSRDGPSTSQRVPGNTQHMIAYEFLRHRLESVRQIDCCIICTLLEVNQRWLKFQQIERINIRDRAL